MRGSFLAVALLAAAGCTGSASDQTGSVENDLVEPGLPELILFAPPEDGPRIWRTAVVIGRIRLDQPCVTMFMYNRHNLLVTDEGTVGRDAQGPFLLVGGEKVRHGQWVRGGGGIPVEGSPPAGNLVRPVPDACEYEAFQPTHRLAPIPESQLPDQGVEFIEPWDGPGPPPPPPPPPGFEGAGPRTGG